MAPKRRPLDPTSRPPKRSKGANAIVTYDTFDDALDAGVIQEEKGERYRVGDKARRHYEEAVKLYELAVRLGEREFEGRYNLARVLYHLSTSFHLPPTALTLLNTSIAHSRASLTLTSTSQLLVDSAYNLSEALLSLAEIIEDTEDGREAEVEGWRREAVSLLEGVAARQEAMIVAERERAESGGAEEADMGEEDEAMDVEAGNGAEDDGEEESAGAATGVARVWEETVTTPSLYLDTLLSLLSTLLLLPLVPAQPPALGDTLGKLRALAPICAASGTPRDVDVLVAESSYKLALLRVTFDANPQARETWEAQGREIIAVLSSAWDAVKAPADPNANPPAPVIELESKVALACALGDAQALLARLLRLSHISSPSSTPPTQQIWTLFFQSTTSSTTALALLTPPPSAFPSFVIPDPSTSTILQTLSTLSLARANLSLPPFAYPASVTNHATLLGNAATYARRAGEVVSAPTAGGGWEKERMGRDAVIGGWRVGFFKGETWEGKMGGKQIRRADVVRFLEEVGEEEGELTSEEKQFWEGVVERLG